MKTSRLPYGIDIAVEYHAWQRARLYRRFAARCGLTLLTMLIAIALGTLVAEGAHWLVVAAITAWGCWGLHHLITRH